ncbi:MAG: hypothetical protein AABY22_05035 [Nanoarchaeota archaeon]
MKKIYKDYKDQIKFKNFKFPPEILHKINECSQGGWLLFTITDGGTIESYSNYDSPRDMLALSNHLTFTANSLQNLQAQLNFRNMVGDDFDPSDDED